MGSLAPSARILALILTSSTLAFARPAPPAGEPPAAPGEERLNEAQRSRDEAEAEYYRELLKRLNEPAPSPTPAKSFQQSIAENPTSALGIIAALLAAFVGLLTLYVNNRASLRSQRDSQFYEALKRFGDKDSPTVRSSAAGMLAQMGKRKVGKNPLVKWIEKGFGVREKFPYYDTVFDQLISGLLLEDNLVSLASIKNALQELITINPYKTVAVLRAGNLSLQNDFVKALAEFWGAEEAHAVKDIDESLWNHVVSISDYNQEILGYFLSKASFKFPTLLKSVSQMFGTFTDAQKREHLILARRNLEVVAARLRTNAELYAHTLREFSLKKIDAGADHSDLFLANADLRQISLPKGSLQNAQLYGADLSDTQLQEANLSNAILTKTKLLRANLQRAVVVGARLERAELWWAKLQGANLSGVRLQEASLIQADLEGANLSNARIDETTNMGDVNWWQAEFGDPEDLLRTLDADNIKLLETLYRRYGEKIPGDTDEVSSSTKTFMTLKSKVTNKTQSV